MVPDISSSAHHSSVNDEILSHFKETATYCGQSRTLAKCALVVLNFVLFLTYTFKDNPTMFYDKGVPILEKMRDGMKGMEKE